MKKILAILAILLAFSVSASAQIPSSPVSFYAGGALSIPSGPDSFKDTFKFGYHGSLGIGYSMSPMIELMGKVEYHTFGIDFANVLPGYSGGSNKMLMYGVDVKLSPSLPAMPIKPYILAGVGMANVKQSEFTGPASLALGVLNSFIPEDQTKMYWNAGVGMNLLSNPVMSLFAQARYVSVATDGESSQFIPITIGVKFL
jgi:opacity protein-like surface antigen